LVDKAKLCAARLRIEEIQEAMAQIPEALRGGADGVSPAGASGTGKPEPRTPLRTEQ
jgi:hypothetical protein